MSDATSTSDSLALEAILFPASREVLGTCNHGLFSFNQWQLSTCTCTKKSATGPVVRLENCLESGVCDVAQVDAVPLPGTRTDVR